MDLMVFIPIRTVSRPSAIGGPGGQAGRGYGAGVGRASRPTGSRASGPAKDFGQDARRTDGPEAHPTMAAGAGAVGRGSSPTVGRDSGPAAPELRDGSPALLAA